MADSTFVVVAMTCGHCVKSVTGELGKIDGVSDVVVDLPTDVVTVTGSEPVSLADVRAAAEEAGYELTAS